MLGRSFISVIFIVLVEMVMLAEYFLSLNFHLGSQHDVNPNDFDVAAQILPNEQQRWRDFSSGSEFSSNIYNDHYSHGLY